MRRDEKQDPIRSEEPAARHAEIPSRHGEITPREGELVARLDRTRIRVSADACLGMTPISLRDYPAPAEGVGRGDFYSMGDYWWPNPETADGLPYVKYDGRSNPEKFVEHRQTKTPQPGSDRGYGGDPGSRTMVEVEFTRSQLCGVRRLQITKATKRL